MNSFSPVSLQFQGYKTRSRMGDLARLNPGDLAVCRTLTPANKGAIEASDLVQIVSIEPHEGKTVNGLRVDRNYDQELTGFDEVDILTYRVIRSRDSERNGSEHTMLYGEYMAEDGIQPPDYGKVSVANHFDPDGNTYVHRVGDLKQAPPAKSVEMIDMESYVHWSTQERNELTRQLPQNKTFMQRLRNLFPSRDH